MCEVVLQAKPELPGVAAGFLCRAHRNIEEPTLRRLAELSETAMKVRSPPKLRHHVAHLLCRHARLRRRADLALGVWGEGLR
jgi:hypothetical protein